MSDLNQGKGRMRGHGGQGGKEGNDDQPLDDYDPLDPQDPHRRDIQHAIPTHPADPVAAGDAGKIVAPRQAPRAPGEPAPVSTGVSSGAPLDLVGGAGLGQAPGEGDAGTPAGTRDRDVKAEDQQDRRE